MTHNACIYVIKMDKIKRSELIGIVLLFIWLAIAVLSTTGAVVYGIRHYDCNVCLRGNVTSNNITINNNYEVVYTYVWKNNQYNYTQYLTYRPNATKAEICMSVYHPSKGRPEQCSDRNFDQTYSLMVFGIAFSAMSVGIPSIGIVGGLLLSPCFIIYECIQIRKQKKSNPDENA